MIQAVPTNIITGFLGVGKTSAINHLLLNKPDNERWAVLINEFGEIGVDGSLVSGNYTEEQGVFIREVPGGCMCCAAGLPMQIALNQLLQRAKPNRLLIEPTGLGHPKEVIQALSMEHYKEVLQLQKILTLVDARKLSDSRYTQHDTFNQQMAIADIIVANKTDLYEKTDGPLLTHYVQSNGLENAKILYTQNGAITLEHLNGRTQATSLSEHSHASGTPRALMSEVPFPECGYVSASNSGEGFKSVGWRFKPEHWFNREKLVAFLSGLKVERMKAVFITSDGVFGYNLSENVMTEQALDDCTESRIEIIADKINEHWERYLLSCLSEAHS